MDSCHFNTADCVGFTCFIAFVCIAVCICYLGRWPWERR